MVDRLISAGTAASEAFLLLARWLTVLSCCQANFKTKERNTKHLNWEINTPNC